MTKGKTEPQGRNKMEASGASEPHRSANVKQEQSQPKPIAGSPEIKPVPWSHPPEVQARIDEFNRKIGPAMAESLRRATADKK